MNSAPYRVRRAVLDDLAALRPMWQSLNLPVADLEKRLTEFQVAVDADGKVVGGIGFRMLNRQADIHSESFSDFALADTVRPLLWERVQTLSANHGMVRLWTREQAPFWKHQGLHPADADELRRLPPEWAGAGSGWLTLRLKDEDAIISLEKEFAMFMAAEKERTARAFRQARLIKYIATALAIVFALFVAAALFYLMRRNPDLLTPRR
ncbi:MAG TPA: hypothetical protein GYA07_00670 [Verrucomicrobia bacterium]|nr:hypothetical protein [Verrucomicrobiota bacterium]HOP98193.1 hypothetical protein [Verrucomicrobiota bacterium]HPU54879.1 hypothetical protein [Verrucomicrobiota bacterium]